MLELKFTFLASVHLPVLLRIWLPLRSAANLPLEGKKQNQQLRCGAIFKHPLLCEPSTRAFLSGIQKKEKKRTHSTEEMGG